MKDHKVIIRVLAEMLLQKENLEIVFSDDPGEHLGADAVFFYRLFKLKDGSLGDGFELVNDGTESHWEKRGEVFVGLAQKYTGAFDIVVKVGIWHLQRNLRLPEAVRFFCADILAGNTKKPKGRHFVKGRDKNFMRNEIFVRYMKFLIEKCEYKPQRNPLAGHFSAADILAAAFHKCGWQMITYDTILNVWKDQAFKDELNELLCR